MNLSTEKGEEIKQEEELNSDFTLPTRYEEDEEYVEYKRKYDSPKYFVFCGQEAGFQTRTILIPWDILPDERKNQIKEIKKLCVEYEGIKNVYFSEIQWEENCGHHINHEPVAWLYHYADNIWDGLQKLEENWYNESYCNVVGGFDHIENYTELTSMKKWKEKPFECVESILVLERDVGKEYRKPRVKTIHEMFQKYYGPELANLYMEEKTKQEKK
jgi:hypothetical protein